MINKSILLNEPYDTTNQQTYNLPNVYINIKNKEYEENNGLHSEKNSNKSSKNLKKSDDYDSLKEYKNIFINQNNTLNINDYTNNQYQTNTIFFQTIKIENENEDSKEEEKEIEKEEEEKSDKNKMLGRKRKDSLTKGKHNKYSNDNLQRKIKSNLLDILFNFINQKIIEKYKNIPNYNIEKDILMKNEQKQIVNTNVNFNQDFLNKTLEEIFSVDISRKFKKCDSEHNKNLIQKLLHDKNDKNRVFFEKILNLTFFECLEHFRGTKKNPELNGIKNFEQFKEQFKNDKEYINLLDYYVMNYEIITFNKKPRKSKDNKENKTITN